MNGAIIVSEVASQATFGTLAYQGITKLYRACAGGFFTLLEGFSAKYKD
jgi:hypothetical protein